MKTKSLNPSKEAEQAFKRITSKSSKEMHSVAQQLRSLVYEVFPQAVEVPWEKQRIIGYGVGEKKMSEHFCYIAPQKAHVNLGFYYGAKLKDPNNLLEGTGKLLRHIKVRSLEEIQKPELRELVIQALAYLPRLVR
jgi:hypothetical protein